jgi:hypothetical protein
MAEGKEPRIDKVETKGIRAFKYRTLAQGELPDWGWHLNDFRSVALRKLAERFLWNSIRTSTLVLMPAWIALEATREQLWFDHATIKSGGTIDPDLTAVASKDFEEPVEAEFNRLVREFRKTDPNILKRLIDEIGITWIERRVQSSQAITESLNAIFSTVILESWTAFECLVSDLWVTTLDKENGDIASRLEVSGILQKPDKEITPKHNIKAEYGSYCLETRRLSFQRLENIKDIYRATFGQNVSELFDKVQGGYIVALYAFRNVLVHKGGDADDPFIELVQRFPEFRGITAKTKLSPDGEQVKKMRDASVYLGRRLIEVADEVLIKQQAT